MGRIVTQKQLNAALAQQRQDLINLLTSRDRKETMRYYVERLRVLVNYVHNLGGDESPQKNGSQASETVNKNEAEALKDWHFGS